MDSFKLDYVAGKWQVRMIGPDGRPCLNLNNKRGKPRRFERAAAAVKAARKYQAELIAFAKF